MDYEITTYSTLSEALESLDTEELFFITPEEIRGAKYYINQGNAYLLAFSNKYNVFVRLKKNPMIKDVIETVVYEFTLSEEGNLKKLSLLFKGEHEDIYNEIIELSDVGIDYYINNPNNPHHHIIQEAIFNLINPYKILVINP